MAFDQPTRNRLQKFVSDGRSLLTEEFTRQLQNNYGLDPVSGDVTALENLAHLDDMRRETARILRVTLAHYQASSPDAAVKDLLERIVREQAFTVLNRLAALRMAEARELLIESVAAGYSSKGFQLYARLAGTGLGETGDAYRCYLFSVFDELALDLAVLFDRFSPMGRLFPRESALLDLLKLLNDPELADLWAEDETIGWIYQYFNSKKERKQMRDASAAPRNSRELAVRNQFFTPRYVVEFLTDNTLGRIWYEMTQGETTLKDRCCYLVRRPTEIFLQKGAAAPESPQAEESLSQEELLKQPVYIPHRPLKDPREIRMLDPACGSMHFGLYAFDLYECIYEEAWDLEEQGIPFQQCAGRESLTATYASKEAFLRDVPRLIIEHNIHGVDIDPRAVQIAGLSLWLRAQKSWQTQGLKPSQRPQIQKSNVVCAEPMPGEERLLNEFLEQHLADTPEQQLVGQLVRRVFEAMKLAGEAGSLLQIEQEISKDVQAAKLQWLNRPKSEQLTLSLLGAEPHQQELPLIVSEITDEYFWERVEGETYKALNRYAEQAENGNSYQRRLFTNDAVRGFAFIDLCRKKFDAVLMNPPFGNPPSSVSSMISSDAANNIYPAFVLRGTDLSDGFVGAITDKTFVVQQSFGNFRSRLTSNLGLIALVELGWGILDDADVQVAIYVVRNNSESIHLFSSLTGDEKPSESLVSIIENLGWTALTSKLINKLPNRVFAHTLPVAYLDHLETQTKLKEVAILPRGLGSNDAYRTYKAWYEVPEGNIGEGKRYRSLSNGGQCSPFFREDAGVAEWLRVDGKLLVEEGYSTNNRAYDQKSYTDYFIAGLSFPKQSSIFNVAVLSVDAIPTREGKGIVPKEDDLSLPLLAYLNSAYVRYFVEATNGLHKQSGPVGMTPVPIFSEAIKRELRMLALRIWQIVAQTYILDEASRFFIHPAELPGAISVDQQSIIAIWDRIDQIIFDAVGVVSEDRLVISATRRPNLALFYPSCSDTFLYAFGVIFGRWDIRFVTGERTLSALPEPFAPLPCCPPGQLQDEQGLPLTKEAVERIKIDSQWEYPVEILWDGILVDDESHNNDIIRRVRDVLGIIWGEKDSDIEQEACESLKVGSLRDYFRKPSAFFNDHLSRYSKSRRQAPIYWPLSTRSGSYTLWLYYHRLTDQTLYTCINDYVEPKLHQVDQATTQLRSQTSRTRDEEKRLETLQTLELELIDLRDELLRIAQLPYKPNLNDGVQITAAPLWPLFGLKKWQTKLKDTWKKLEKGDYDWAHLAYTIWPDRVREKCKGDKSLAIAHDLEALYEAPPEKPKKSRRPRT